MRNTYLLAFTLGALITGSMISGQISEAAVMQGGQFQVTEDALDLAGGLGVSERYQAVDSAGGVAVGSGASENFTAQAGYTPNAEPVFIALSGVAPVIMDTPIGGLSGGESDGSLTVTVTTDNFAGYQLSIASEDAIAMQGTAGVIQNYTPDNTAETLVFTTASTDAHFGYSVFGTDATTDFISDGSACGTGVSTRGFCWQGLSTSTVVVAEGVTANIPNGTDTEILYRVGIGNEVMQLPGTYVATTTITALPR